MFKGGKSMNDEIFGEVNFQEGGWIKREFFTFCNKKYDVEICAMSENESDLITDEQREGYSIFSFQNEFMEFEILNLLRKYKNGHFFRKLIPSRINFNKLGGFAFLFFYKTDSENGIAVVISPIKSVMTTDEYFASENGKK
jgi:hypothetical protein